MATAAPGRASGAGKASPVPARPQPGGAALPVKYRGLLTLGVDPSTGRVLTLAYRGRGPGGVFGEIVESFSDFRTVEGLSLPFKVTGTFNGAADPMSGWVVRNVSAVH